MKLRRVAGLAAVAVASIAFRLIHYLAYRPVGLTPDEIGFSLLFWKRHALHAQMPRWWENLMPKMAGWWPPGYSLVSAAVAHLLGDPIVAARLVSIAFAGTLAAATYLLAARLVRDEGAGLVAGLLVAFAPLFALWDLRNRPESLFMTLYVFSVLFAVRYMDRRRVRELAIATALCGLAAFVKYEAVILAAALGLVWISHLRVGDPKDLLIGLAGALSWCLPAWWFLTHEPLRAGDYATLFSLQMLRQFVVWSAHTFAALPWVVLWPVFLLAVFGCFRLAGRKASRRHLALLLYLVFAFMAAMAVGYNWIPRYYLMVLPFVAALAAAGWRGLPSAYGVRAIVAAVVVAYSAWTAHSWIAAERERWTEAIGVGEACARMCPSDAVVWSDDVMVIPYWAGRDMRKLDILTRPEPGDYVILHDLIGALDTKRTVATSFERMAQIYDYEVLYDCTARYVSLSGEAVFPEELARVKDLRTLGPYVFWKRKRPISVRAVLLRIEARK